MRITGGILSGRKLEAPEGASTRPTSDRVREAIFNILAHRDWGDHISDAFEGVHALDAFCGTGAFALESLSYGAKQATLFDIDRKALSFARVNAEKLGLLDRCAIMPVDATHPPAAKSPCQLIFLDPPYRKNLVPLALKALDEAGWIAPHALIVAETGKSEKIPWPDSFTEILNRAYGDTAVCFLVKNI
ncbi:MAG: 16S rRNA (guanine(966)-N(2))-methyltransferase RsmD [Alphaproteobacteria bacterium]|nr:16S rRNA (guanine(966)-N(2))-methyltransferase RsmD [Alphaproteobacteria bacterium]